MSSNKKVSNKGFAKLKTCAVVGIDAIPIDVEIEVSFGKTRSALVGMGDGAVKESKERVTAAVRQSGFTFPEQVVLISLAPADVKKEGGGFDLPIAVGVLVASGQVVRDRLGDLAIVGELALDGRVRPVRGVLSMSVAALDAGIKTIIVPRENVDEATLIGALNVIGVDHLIQVAEYLNGAIELQITKRALINFTQPESCRLSDVWGQERAKRAMIIAAAGGHNLLMIGPPGCGKSMLAERFSGLLPPLIEQEIREVVKIHSVAGLPVQGILRGMRPYRHPHHIVSDVGLVGGGSSPRPGEVSLAHRGVLFLDEFPEFRRSAIESLRAPLEGGSVVVSRAKGTVKFPAKIQLVAAMNPCPCGRLGVNGASCSCSMVAIQGYLSKLSQPILDRIDLHVELDAVPLSVMTGEQASDRNSDNEMVQLVAGAREQQLKRAGCLNAELDSNSLKQFVALKEDSIKLLEIAANRFGFSARTYVRILRVALTISDLSGEGKVNKNHIAEAIGLRTLEKLKRFSNGIEKVATG